MAVKSIIVWLEFKWERDIVCVKAKAAHTLADTLAVSWAVT